MLSLVPRRALVILIVTPAVAVFLVAAIIDTTAIETPWKFFRILSVAVVIAEGLWIAAATWFWRRLWSMIPSLNRVVFPDLNGVWKGKIDSTSTSNPKQATLRIRQTWFGIHLTLETDESTSHTYSATLDADRAAGRFLLRYHYRNEPKAAVADRNTPHDGACVLEMTLDHPTRLRGKYFTARRTTGDIEFQQVARDPEQSAD